MYTEQEQSTGRFWWIIFSIVNTFSFQFLAGNVIILFLKNLGANNTLIGIVSSFLYASYFIMPFGRRLSQSAGIVRGFSIAWGFRYLAMSPILYAALIAINQPTLAMVITIVSFFGFQMLRGAGLVSFSPIVTEISHGEDRGRYLSLSRIFTDLSILIGTLGIAFLLGRDAPPVRYFISFGIGILLGALAVASLSRIPEIKRQKGHKDESLLKTLRTIIQNRAFRNFFLVLAVTTFLNGIIRPFILIYAKDVYQISDSNVLLLTVAGSAGAILMGLISRRILDKVGAKPMALVWIFSLILSSSLIVWMPNLGGVVLWIYLSLLFFWSMMGLNGIINTNQTYFFSMITAQQQLNIGILFFLCTGFAGVAGSTIAGTTLDVLQISMSVSDSHRILFASITVGLIAAFFLASRMDSQGAIPLGRQLSELFLSRQRIRGQQ
jgi:MFS family permease